MKDRVYMVLGFIGFVIIAVVVVLNVGSHTLAEYEIEASYTPNKRTDLISSQELYNQLTGARSLTCPVTAMSRTSDTLVVLTSIWGSYYDHPYSLNNLFITNSCLSPSGGVVNPTTSGYKSDLHLSAKASSSDTVTIGELFDCDIFSLDENIEIVAPFNFVFGNVNSNVVVEGDDPNNQTRTQSIIISNVSGTCRITFDNVANWFCAGPVGQTSVMSNASDGILEWGDHCKAHHSIIGNSANAIVKGGSSGSVIGYANRNTTVTIEVYKDGSYKKVSLDSFIVSAN